MLSVKIDETLTLSKNDDGHWLNFIASDGKKASLNLESAIPQNEKSIVRTAILQWANDMLERCTHD